VQDLEGHELSRDMIPDERNVYVSMVDQVDEQAC